MNKRLLIGIVSAECHIDFRAETLKGIISQAFKSSCDVAVISSFHNFFFDTAHKNGEREIFRLILSDRFDGFLYDRNTFYSEDIRSFIDDLLVSSGKPVMLLDSGGHRRFESTAIDDCSAFEEITDHLIDVHGYRDIWCLTGPKKQFVSEERLSGFRRSMKNHGIPVSRESCIYGDFWVDAARKLAEDIVSGKVRRPEAIVCGNDHSAMSLITALTEGGISVPGDIAVTGYDDSADGRSFTPSVTSFRRPNFQLGAEAFRRLYRIITGKICTRIGNENVALRLGESCGCTLREEHSSKANRRSLIRARYMADALNGDMLFDISNTATPREFIDRLDNYTYLIYKMRRMYVCLTRDYLESGEELSFSADSMVKPMLSKTYLSRIYGGNDYFRASELLPVFSESRPYPVAYYITPLQAYGRFFGYGAISFGKEPISFDELYVHWTSFAGAALDRLSRTMTLERRLAQAQRLAYTDGNSGLPNRKGIETGLPERFGAEELSFICIRLSGMGKIYYSSGEEKADAIAAAFSDMLRRCVREDELCGLWSTSTFVVVTRRNDRAEELFRELSAMAERTGFGTGEGSEVTFNIGVHRQTGIAEPGKAVHRASVNRIYGYSAAESDSNPQFEKLCRLRDRIAKEPELQWSISEIADELYLSKSYLQKIYKTYFGRGIIEDMTAFRMDRARELLTKTDLTVTEIARECGYSTYNYFVRRFKAEEGMSPNEYRASACGEGEVSP